MHKSNEDCFYFLTSSCAKGLSCTYRHNPLASTCNVICPSWLRGNCPDPACPFRHSTIQRPKIGNGILCFYENTPTGCLKPECTFIHSRPRLNLRNPSAIRPASTNLIKNETAKPVANTTLPTDLPQTAVLAADSNVTSSQTTIGETPSVTSTSTNEPASNPNISSPIVKTETITRRIAIPSDLESSNDKKNLLENNTSDLKLTKSVTRSIITDSPKSNQEEIPPINTLQSRVVVNRNVLLSEPTKSPSRTIVQTAPSSNRVVVSSDSIHSPPKGKKNDSDTVKEENDSKRFKQDSQSIIDIPFPCPTSSITNRLLLMSSKETTPTTTTATTNDPKPIRLNRHRLPATQTSSGNSPSSVSTPSNEEKTSAGTELSKDDERRTMRIERFQKKTISPPRSVVRSTSTTNNVTANSPATDTLFTSSHNERKRTAPESTIKDAPPSKRISTPSLQKQSSSRQTTASLNTSGNSTSTIRNTSKEQQANGVIAKTTEQKVSSPAASIPAQTTLSSVVRPRFVPQPITPPSPLQQSTTTTARPRQPPSVTIKRPLASVTAPSQTSTKSIEQVSSNNTGQTASLPTKSTIEHSTSNTLNEEDENQLLKLNESADIVDTFAFIDEALLEADNLLELM